MGKSEKVSLGDIEAGLERLMPRGLTEDTRLELESVVEGLAEEVEGGAGDSFWHGARFLQAAAAVLIAALGLGFFLHTENQVSPVLASLDGASQEHGIELLEQRTWIESGSELGSRTIDEAEEVSQGWSYSGVEEERLLHGDSGYEVILQREFEAELFASSSL